MTKCYGANLQAGRLELMTLMKMWTFLDADRDDDDDETNKLVACVKYKIWKEENIGPC